MLKHIKNESDYIATLSAIARFGIVSYATAAAFYALKNENESPFRANYVRAQRILNRLHDEKLVSVQYADSVKCFSLTTKAVNFLKKNHRLSTTVNTDSLTTAYHRLLADFTTLTLVKNLKLLGIDDIRYSSERQCLQKKGEMRIKYRRRPDGVIQCKGGARSVVIEVEKSRRKDFAALMYSMRNYSGTPEGPPVEASLWVFVVNQDTRADTLRALQNEFVLSELDSPDQALKFFNYWTDSVGAKPITQRLMSSDNTPRFHAKIIVIEYDNSSPYLKQLETLANPALARVCADVL